MMHLQATPFEGQLASELKQPEPSKLLQKPHIQLRTAVSVMEMVLWGYAVPIDLHKTALQNFTQATTNPLLPVHEVCG